MAIVEVVDLKKYFPLRRGLLTWVKRKKAEFTPAVDGVTLKIEQGEIFGLVGESGSGKTTLARLILRLLEPTGGRIFFGGVDVSRLKGAKLKDFRKKAQVVFQDPYASLNPRRTVMQTVQEPLSIHGLYGKEERKEVVIKMLKAVGLTREEYLNMYPYQLSGGERQRVAICRALILNPSFVVLDEPVSMLDASIRIGVLNLLLRLRKEFHLTYLFISHDLALARYICNRVAVMHLGKIVEMGETEEIIQNPLHPYSQLLISAVPAPDPHIKISVTKSVRRTEEHTNTLTGGCRFHPFCDKPFKKCRENVPPLKEIEKGRLIACWKY
ncbi:MAG: ATP-binding cassette domain-containing protein [Candidatus Bathyarchaeia archaeon]